MYDMKEKTIYMCDSCSKMFYDKDECRKHEIDCYPCNRCQHQYFVYGCEETCDYWNRNECVGRKSDNAELFRAKFLYNDK